MNMIRYCHRCITPETRPDLHIDEEGVCSACRAFEARPTIDWDARRSELVKILDRYRCRDGSNYDCIVPVSGGKDSTYQVLKMLQLGMNPLCVVATTCHFSDLGRRNLENLKNLGVDCVEVTTNPQVRAKLNRIGLEQVGDVSWPEHCSIFTIPVRVAAQHNVPLLVWGENSQNEYGGPCTDAENNVLTRRWLEEFGGLNGMRVSDMIGMDGIEAKHLIPFTYPTDEDLQRVGVTGIFLGYYLPWDGQGNAVLAQGHGMEFHPNAVEGHLFNFENLDNCQAGIHEYFMFLKYGFGRATSQAGVMIRRGRLARQDAIDIIRQREGKFPASYLGKPLAEILAHIGMNVDEFTAICDSFTNRKLFRTDNRGNLIKTGSGDLIKLNYDNV